MLCPKCGKNVEETAKFCGFCGADILVEKVNNEEEHPRRGEGNSSTEKEDRRRDKPPSSNWLILMIVLLVMAILVGSGFFVHVFFNTPYDSASSKHVSSTGNIHALSAGFTSISIIDEGTAIEAASSLSDDLGFINAFDDLTPFQAASIDGENYYRLQQNYNEIPVYNRYVVVVASDDGEALEIITDAVDISEDLNLDPSVTFEQVRQSIMDYAADTWHVIYDDMSISELMDDNLVIFVDDDDTLARLAYKVAVTNGNVYEVVVDAHTGEVLDHMAAVSDVSSTGTNLDGTKTFPASYNESRNEYTLMDEDRSIYIFNQSRFDSQKNGFWQAKESLVSVGDSIFGNTPEEAALDPEMAINLLTNVELLAKYYKETVGQSIPFGTVIACYNDGNSNGNQARGGMLPATNEETGENLTYGYLTVGYKFDCTELDMLAHEYTHIVARAHNAATGKSVTTQAVSEGLADTFACFFTEDWDVDLSKLGIGHRNATDPAVYGYPATVDDKNNSKESNDHAYATVVSHAAYLMYNSSEFSYDELAKLWFKTVLRLPSNCKFSDLRFCMEQAAATSEISTTQRNVIMSAFDEVGIYLSVECSNQISIVVRDKSDERYDDYTVQVDGRTSGGLFGIGSEAYSQTIVSHDYEDCNLTLDNGSYVIKVIDNANTKEFKEFKIKVDKNNEDNSLYVSGFGADYTAQSDSELIVLDVDGNQVYKYLASVKGMDRQFSSGPIGLEKKNYYTVIISSEYPHLGAIYYDAFTLRVKDEAEEQITVKTNFPSLLTVPLPLDDASEKQQPEKVLLAVNAYDENDGLAEVIHFDYNENGLISRSYHDSYSGGILTDWGYDYIYTYDEAGRLISRYYYVDQWDSGFEDVIRSYDSNGLLVSDNMYSEGEVSVEKEYAYDEGGRMVWERTINGSPFLGGKVENEYSYSYHTDEHDQTVGVRHNETDPSAEDTEVIYNAAGQLIQGYKSELTYGTDGKTIYEYLDDPYFCIRDEFSTFSYPYDTEETRSTNIRYAIILDSAGQEVESFWLGSPETAQMNYDEDGYLVSVDNIEDVYYARCEFVYSTLDENVEATDAAQQKQKLPPLAYETRTESYEYTAPDNSVTTSDLSYPYFTDDYPIAAMLNEKIEKDFAERRHSDTDSQGGSNEDKSEAIEDGQTLSFIDNVEIMVTYNDDGLISLLYNSYVYGSGAAHGWKTCEGYIYDTSTCEQLDYRTLAGSKISQMNARLAQEASALGLSTGPSEAVAYALTDEGLCFYYESGPTLPWDIVVVPFTSEYFDRAPIDNKTTDSESTGSILTQEEAYALAVAGSGFEDGETQTISGSEFVIQFWDCGRAGYNGRSVYVYQVRRLRKIEGPQMTQLMETVLVDATTGECTVISPFEPLSLGDDPLADNNDGGETSTPENEHPTQEAHPTLTVTGNGVNIRSGPGTSYGSIGSVNKGDILFSKGKSDNWYMVEYGNSTGYIIEDYVTIEHGGFYTAVDSGTLSVNGTDVNIRSGPGTEYQSIGSVSSGTTLTVTGKSDNWFQVSYNGRTGYIIEDYVIKNK